MTDWVQIPHSSVLHHWHSANPNSTETVTVSPDYYEENGNPMDANGEDMVYSHTEVKMPMDALHRLIAIQAAFTESDLFYTPNSKEAAEAWCRLQGGEAMLGFMVGINYASAMIKQLAEGTHPSMVANNKVRKGFVIIFHCKDGSKTFAAPNYEDTTLMKLAKSHDIPALTPFSVYEADNPNQVAEGTLFREVE